MFDSTPHPLALSVSVLVSIYAFQTIRRHNVHKYPPGPKGIPFLGNVFQLSTTPWREFELWKKSYGPLVYITVAGQGILVLNTHEVAGDLLDRRGNVYSDRPRWIVASEILSGGLMVVFAHSGDMWRRMRRAGHEPMKKPVVTEYHPIQLKEAVILTENLLRNQNDWEAQFLRVAASTVLSVVYDLPPVLSPDDPLVQKVDEFTRTLAAATKPGSSPLVELFPWMKHIPPSLAKWKRDAEEGYRRYSDMFVRMFREVKERIEEGDERRSFVRTLIREQGSHHLSDLEAAWLAATMYAGAAETSSTIMNWFMLAMIAYPEKQKKCQEELDAVVGRARLPTFEDRNNLPYIKATVRELLRWRAVLPLGVPHVTTEDDWYKGYFIPKGTMCLPNIWSMNRDRAIYGRDADDFNPDRFIDGDGQVSPALTDTKDGHVTYGFGPRICMGRHMANNSLFINVATILWAANISPAKDTTGIPIIPDTFATVNDEPVIRPLPFKCLINPRFPQVPAILAQTKELL